MICGGIEHTEGARGMLSVFFLVCTSQQNDAIEHGSTNHMYSLTYSRSGERMENVQRALLRLTTLASLKRARYKQTERSND
jgi:hypothetical protein